MRGENQRRDIERRADKSREDEPQSGSDRDYETTLRAGDPTTAV
jgi:hypothetical protein